MTVLRKWLGSGLLFIFAAAAFAQSPISTQQVNIPISVGLPAPPIPLGSATVTGTQTPGNYFNATYYFWVVAEFTVATPLPQAQFPVLTRHQLSAFLITVRFPGMRYRAQIPMTF